MRQNMSFLICCSQGGEVVQSLSCLSLDILIGMSFQQLQQHSNLLRIMHSKVSQPNCYVQIFSVSSSPLCTISIEVFVLKKYLRTILLWLSAVYPLLTFSLSCQ